MSWIEASLLHAVPGLIFTGLGHPVCCGASFDQFFAQTAARLRPTPSQSISVNDNVSTAIADARPFLMPHISEDGQAFETPRDQIDFGISFQTAAAFPPSRPASTQITSIDDSPRSTVTNTGPHLISRITGDDEASDTLPGKLDQLTHVSSPA
jgi:hypothetical protein